MTSELKAKALVFYNRLVDDYKDTVAKERTATDKMTKALWADRRRKIEKVFQKTFGKPIDKYVEM